MLGVWCYHETVDLVFASLASYNQCLGVFGGVFGRSSYVLQSNLLVCCISMCATTGLGNLAVF